MSLARYFRQAQAASSGYNLWKTLLQSVVFWSVFLLILPALLVWIERSVALSPFRFASQTFLGGSVFAVASILNVWSGVIMAVVGQGTPLPTDGPRRLVVVGPYRWLRNPMAVGGLAQGAGIGVALGSGLMLIAVVVGGLLWNQFVRPVEELHLAATFGDEFKRYQSAVRCWIPRVKPYETSAQNQSK